MQASLYNATNHYAKMSGCVRIPIKTAI